MAIQGEVNREAEAETQQFLSDQPLPIHDPIERRAICLRLAIEANVGYHVPSPPDVGTYAEMILGMARAFEAYVSGQEES